MPEPNAFIELADKPLNPGTETLNDRRLRSVARWHAFAMREEARVSGDLQEHETDTKQGTREDGKQEPTSSDKTKTVESQDPERMSCDEDCRHGTAERDSSAINDGESPEKKQAVFERAAKHDEPLHTLDFTRVHAQKLEMPIIKHFAAAGSHEDESVTAPHTPAPEAKAEKTSGDKNHLNEEEVKERSMMWE
ncbi:hypothetical protein LTR74_000796 [Friedmanniomyces endolithicus]|nr:hypothetical protein LTR74_000796 [Friedmanniomyces endolithicus]